MRTLIGKFVTVSAVTGALLVSCLVPGTASAQRNRMNTIQHRQLNQIHQGVKNGDLTKQQATKLAKQERDINALKTQASDKADATPAQRAEARSDVMNKVNKEEKEIKTGEQKNEANPQPTPVSSQPPL
jgi:hypothetical protein